MAPLPVDIIEGQVSNWVSVGSIPSDHSAGDGEIGNLTIKSRVCLFNLQVDGARADQAGVIWMAIR
jgi:hypothetical protein